MAKIKFSKTELKTQRDKLKQFTRFLPTLQLKKQQLQMEVMQMNEQIAAHKRKVEQFKQSIQSWVSLYGTQEAELVREKVEIREIVLDIRNIAGVDIPVLEDVLYQPLEYDLFQTSTWVDAGIEAFQELIKLQIGSKVLARQRQLLEEELRITTQRVNLFEKVKIPEAKENIRVIRIYLGDQQTAAVGRAKIAKNKLIELQSGA